MRKTSLKEVAYQKIKQGIFNGDFQRGVIYSAQYFADYLNMSRTPVREAVLQLVNENFVDIHPNRGLMIKNFDSALLLELSQVRSMIDGYCAAYLAENIHSIDALITFKKLKDIGLEQEDLLKNDTADSKETSTKWYDLDARFHRTIIDFVGNQYMNDSISDIEGYIKYMGLVTAGIQDRKADSMLENEKILEAIEKGDAMKAFETASYHALQIFQVMDAYIKQNEVADTAKNQK